MHPSNLKPEGSGLEEGSGGQAGSHFSLHTGVNTCATPSSSLPGSLQVWLLVATRGGGGGQANSPEPWSPVLSFTHLGQCFFRRSQHQAAVSLTHKCSYLF